LPTFTAYTNIATAVPGVSRVGLFRGFPMLLGSQASSALGGLLNDLFSLQNNLCNVYGKCCLTNNCNKCLFVCHLHK